MNLMMLLLLLNIIIDSIQLPVSHCKCSVTFLPVKSETEKLILVNKHGRASFYIPYKIIYCDWRVESEKDMKVIRHAVYGYWITFLFPDYSINIFLDCYHYGFFQESFSPFRRKYIMHIQFCKWIWFHIDRFRNAARKVRKIIAIWIIFCFDF